jgi:hypothetical protein
MLLEFEQRPPLQPMSSPSLRSPVSSLAEMQMDVKRSEAFDLKQVDTILGRQTKTSRRASGCRLHRKPRRQRL